MTDRIKRLAAVLGGAAVLAVGLPASAHAAELPVVEWARSDFDGDVGTLLVAVTAPGGVESVAARLTTIATGEEVASSDEFVLRSGTVTDGVWATAEPFLLDELGSYRAHVTVTGPAGEQVHRENAGFLSYVVRTSLEEITLDPATVTYEQREVTVSGVLTARWPGTGEVEPLAGREVTVSKLFDFGDTVVTGADGSFSGSVTITMEDELFLAEFGSDEPFVRGAQTELLTVPIDPRPTWVGIRVRPRRVDLGETAVVKGWLGWKTPDGWRPISDAAVAVQFCTQISCATVPGGAVTDATGRYRVVAEPPQTGFYRVSYRPGDPFVAPVVAETGIAVLQPAWFSEFTADRDERGVVVMAGEVQFGEGSPLEIPVQIQFSPNGVADWRTVTTVDATVGELGHFSTEVADGRSGYWRARYPGLKDHFQPALSTEVFVS